MEAGNKRPAGCAERPASSSEVKNLRRQMSALNDPTADLTIEKRHLRKSTSWPSTNPASGTAREGRSPGEADAHFDHLRREGFSLIVEST